MTTEARLLKEHPPVKISYGKFEDNRFADAGKVWGVTRLMEKAKGLEPFDLPLRAIYIGQKVWKKIETPLALASHMRQVMAADLSYPIILDEEGFIMDGWHRVAKALFEGHSTIKAVRFDITPPHDFTED